MPRHGALHDLQRRKCREELITNRSLHGQTPGRVVRGEGAGIPLVLIRRRAY